MGLHSISDVALVLHYFYSYNLEMWIIKVPFATCHVFQIVQISILVPTNGFPQFCHCQWTRFYPGPPFTLEFSMVTFTEQIKCREVVVVWSMVKYTKYFLSCHIWTTLITFSIILGAASYWWFKEELHLFDMLCLFCHIFVGDSRIV